MQARLWVWAVLLHSLEQLGLSSPLPCLQFSAAVLGGSPLPSGIEAWSLYLLCLAVSCREGTEMDLCLHFHHASMGVCTII